MDHRALADGFLTARATGTAYIPPSTLGQPLDLPQAYAVQRAFVARCRDNGERIVGYKAAANAAALQQRLQLTQPIVGALFGSGEVANGAEVDRASYRGLLIETELAFRAARQFDKPVSSLAELRNAISTVMPMFELAAPGFGRAAIVGTDLIAANSASAGIVRGPAMSVQSVDPNALRVRLCCDGALLHEAEGRDLAGDQWQALLWLVNTAYAEGYRVQPGDLLMTGSLGPAHPAGPGQYVAEFGALGTLSVRVR